MGRKFCDVLNKVKCRPTKITISDTAKPLATTGDGVLQGRVSAQPGSVGEDLDSTLRPDSMSVNYKF